MKNCSMQIASLKYLILLFTITVGYLNSSAQLNKSDEMAIDNAIDSIANILDDAPITDSDNDGIPDESDLCPETKGSLKYYGCLAESDKYSWDTYEYEVYPASVALEVTPAKYETITEQYLVKPAHKEGTTFETIEEQVVAIEASTGLEVVESEFLKTEREIVIDELTNKTIKIENFERAGPPSVKEVAIPAEYQTIEKYKVVKNGTGAEVPSEYKTSSRKVLVAPASVKEVAVLAVKKVVKIRVDKSEPEIFTIVEEMPVFPGGDTKLLKHFGNNIAYPPEAVANSIQGVVVLGFTVAKDGSIKDVEVIRDIGGGCGEEAKRLAEQMPKWTPGKQRGKPVNVAFKLPVRFKLEDNQKKGRKKRK